MRRLSLLLLIFLLGAPLVASAQVYKWTDAHGTVHYSDTRPAHGTKYARVKIAADVTTPATKSDNNAAATTPDTDASSNTTPSSNSTGRVADTPSNRQKLCTTLTANIALLKKDKPVVMRGPDGKNQLLSKQRKAEQLAKAQKQYQAFCKS